MKNHKSPRKPASEHDRLAQRLTDLLYRLNLGEALDLDALAEEYRVHPRTIRRDLTERFAFFPIEKKQGRYVLDPSYLGRLRYQDIEKFAALAGVKGLFPSLDSPFFRELLDSRLQDTLSVHSPNYEDLHARQADFKALQQAITHHKKLKFLYQKPEGEKWVTVEPYRLVNNNAVWYLAAVESEKPKSYAFSKMSALCLLPDIFKTNPDVIEMLDKEDSIWLNAEKTEVVLTVAMPAAVYFKRRKLIAQQVIEKELADGGLIVSGKFAHPNQILPIVRQWVPCIRIVSPVAWQEELEAGLRGYLG